MYAEKTRTKVELKMLQSLPLELKIEKTKLRVTEFINYYGESGCYISFSGGKDSTVLKHIIDNMGYNIESVYIDTGLEYPEIKQFIKDNKCTIIKPEMSFYEIIKKYGYPVFSKEIAKNIEYGRKALLKGDYKKVDRYLFGVRYNKYGERYIYSKPNNKAIEMALHSDIKISSKCCDIMKKNPAKKFEKEFNKHPFIATLCSESEMRTTSWLQNGCNSFNTNRPMSTPLSFWTEQDILRYIVKYNIKICSVYGNIINNNDKLDLTGCKRTGCLFCMFGIHKEKSPNRLEILKNTHYNLYKYCLNTLGCKDILDILNVKY